MKSQKEAVTQAVDYTIERLKARFEKTGRPVDFDFREFCTKWVWARRSDAYTHYMHSYPGKLLPYIPIFFLSSSFCREDEIVLDPMAGTGTVLVEAIVHPYAKRKCLGVEINPLARLIAKVKTTPLNISELENRSRVLFLKTGSANRSKNVPDFKNIDLWFSRRSQEKLGRLKAFIEALPNDDYRDFFFVCFSSLIRRVSLADPNIPPPVVLKPEKYKRSPERMTSMRKFLQRSIDPDVTRIFNEIVTKNIRRMQSVSSASRVWGKGVGAHIVWDDARDLRIAESSFMGSLNKERSRKFRKNTVGLIITSPPYLTAQKYIRSTKLEMFWLDLVREDEINELDKQVVGTENVSTRDPILFSGVKSVDETISRVHRASKLRAQMVSKYFIDMKRITQNLYNVLKKGRRLVLVVGANRVTGKSVKTHMLLAEMGVSAGFRVELVLRDRIRGRGMITSRHESGGLINEEYVVVLQRGS